MTFRTEGDLRRAGFSGFVAVTDLLERRAFPPDCAGVYVVVHACPRAPRFRARSSAGFFCGRDPSIAAAELNARWVRGTCVAYIGRARGVRGRSSLRGRIATYVKHGAGARAAHWGGRAVWQLPRTADLRIAWRACSSTKAAPHEKQLLNEFRACYGRLPFANRLR